MNQDKITHVGLQLHKEMSGEQAGLFDADFWQGKLIEWVIKDPDFKRDLFRFVDVLPALQSHQNVSKHIKEYFLKENRELPGVIAAALKAASGSWTSKLGAGTIKHQIEGLAHRFIIGEDGKSALKTLRKLWVEGYEFTVDLLGEETHSDAEADAYVARYTEMLDTLSSNINLWNRKDGNNWDIFSPRGNISLKLSAMAPHIAPEAKEHVINKLLKRTQNFFDTAKSNNFFINLDLEQWKYHDITYGFLSTLLEDPNYRQYPHLGIVSQGYLKSSLGDLEELLALAKKRNASITVRLVKGAYWDYEVVSSRQYGYECPVFEDKAKTDINYEKASEYLMQNRQWLRPAYGSHNLRSLANALCLADKYGAKPGEYEFQMLYGMAEPERRTFKNRGELTRLYCPVGEMLPGISYLVRRLLENTSNDGFLRLSHHDHTEIGKLLMPPLPSHISTEGRSMTFENCPLLDFGLEKNRTAFNEALVNVRNSFPRNVPVVLCGTRKINGHQDRRTSPNDPSQNLGSIRWASLGDAKEAIQSALGYQKDWANTSLEERVGYLNALADVLEADRFELAALMVHEVGKPRAEADGDVAEAVDFCRYYAADASNKLRAQPQKDVLGQQNRLQFRGRGPTSVIAPWNFPLAILCGMTVGPLVAGNTVLMKPAEQSSIIGYELYKRMMQVGIPSQAVQFLPGCGEEIGPHLVEDPNIAQIVFTGSKEVGHQIYGRAAKVHPDQKQMKRVICEMGGKNAIIVDDDADLDEAVGGVVKAAYGFSGQKCSACSRILVLDEVYDTFKERLIGAVRSLHSGSAVDPANDYGPVVDKASYNRLKNIIGKSYPNTTLLYEGSKVDPRNNETTCTGYFLGPTLFETSDPKGFLMQNELFGPVLTMMRVKNLDEALAVANDVPFALTGAIYSRSPENLKRAQAEFAVGNLYLNQPCTGAIVARQPFGGFGMSGTGIKAGGPGYLMHFVDQVCVSENTMRRGFTPELG